MRARGLDLAAAVLLGCGGGLLLLAPVGEHGPVHHDAHVVPAPLRGQRSRADCAILNRTFRLAPACDGFSGGRATYVYPLLITGTGRAGTRFAALSFRAAGYGLAHDDGRLGRDGAVSWPLALRETNSLGPGPDGYARTYELPNFARRPNTGLRGTEPAWRFRRVFHQVRHPLKVVRSRANRIGMMVAPLAYSNPYLFRDAFGYAPGFPPPDELAAWHADRKIDAWPLEKRLRVALFHYTFWNDWVAAYADHTFKIEDFDVDDLARRAGLEKRAKTRARLPRDGVNSQPLDPALVNLTWADLERVSPVVWRRATTLARGFGYDV